jgi:hypothetical protein
VIRVELPDASTPRFDTLDSSYYPLHSRQEVWVDGDKTRLVAEPYDGSGWGAAGLLGIGLGLAFLWAGWNHRRRLGSFFLEPQPVTAIGASVIPGAAFLFDGERDWKGSPRWVLPLEDDELELDEEAAPPAPEPATAYGLLADGEPVGLRLHDGRLLLGAGPLLPWLDDEADEERDWREVLEDEPLPAPATAGVEPIGDGALPARWRHLRGALLMLGALGGVVLDLTDRGASTGDLLFRLGLCVVFYANGYAAASARVAAAPDGVVVDNPLRSTRIPWVGVQRFAVFDDGVLLLTRDGLSIPMLASLSTAMRKSRRATDAERNAARLQARLEREHLAEPAFVHPNDRRPTTTSRWEPGAAALLFALVALAALQLR